MKLSKKILSVLTALTLSTSMLVPVLPAAAVTDNGVSKVKTVDSDFKGALTTLTIQEDGNSHQDFVSGDSFVVTLPSGVKFATYDNAKGYVEATSGSVTGATYVDSSSTSLIGGSMKDVVSARFSNERTLTVNFNGNGDAKEDDTVALNIAVIVDGATGDINASIDGLDSGISSGEVLIGRVASSGTINTVLNTESIGDADKQECGVVRVTETTANNFEAGDEVTFTLNNGFKFNSVSENEITLLGGFPSNLNLAPSLNDDKDELTLKFPASYAGTSSRGIIELVPYVDVNNDADYGDVTIDVDGDNVDASTLTVATYGTFGATVSAKTVEDVVAGDSDVDFGNVIIKETTAGSFINGRKITITLPEYAKFVGAKDNATTLNVKLKSGDKVWTKGFVVDTTDRHVAKLTIDRSIAVPSKACEMEVEMKHINTQIDMTGDVSVTVSSSSGMEDQDVVVAKSIAPVTATVAKTADVKLGVNGQDVSDITITENKSGAIQDGTSADELYLDIDYDGVKFAATPTVEVTSGNLKLGTISKTTNGNNGSDTRIKIKIDNDSSQPSTIKVSGIKFNVDRTVATGNIKVKVKGTAVALTNKASLSADNEDMFDAGCAASVFPANVINAAPEAGSILFNIGSTIYYQNGIAKVMDAAPVVKNSRTYVPVRYLGYALGVSDTNIGYDQATGTVTLTKGDQTVKLVIGDKNLSVNDTVTAMDVAPEVMNGRTMLPARFVAEALGAQVGYSNGQVVVSY